MSFMEPEVIKCRWYKIETNQGTWFVPYEVVGDVDDKDKLGMYTESGTVQDFEIIEGWGARMSAPGYLDCTDWCVFETEEAAVEYLAEEYGEEIEEKPEEKEGES